MHNFDPKSKCTDGENGAQMQSSNIGLYLTASIVTSFPLQIINHIAKKAAAQTDHPVGVDGKERKIVILDPRLIT